ncbi:MAG: TonB family protein [Parabacteroides merdae]
MARVLNEKVAEVIQQPTVSPPLLFPKWKQPIRFHRKKTRFMTHVISCRNFRAGKMHYCQFLAKNIKYPAEAQQQGKQGKVVVTFVIEKDGSITNAKVTQALYPSIG